MWGQGRSRGSCRGSALAGLALIVTAAGCGNSNTRAIPHDLAIGAGFQVKLPTGWRSFDQTAQNQIVKRTSAILRAKGIAADGILKAGHWIDPGSKDKNSLVVYVEPATTDTTDAAITASSDALLRRGGATGIHQLSAPTRLSGLPVHATTYKLNGADVDVLTARRGSWLYSITIGNLGTGDLSSLMDTIRQGWQWTSTDVPELTQLEHFKGHGYTVTLPSGWTGRGSAAAKLAGAPSFADAVWTGHEDAAGISVVTVDIKPAGSSTLDQLAASELPSSGGRREPDESVGGSKAAVLDAGAGDTHVHAWLMVRGSQLFEVILKTDPSRSAIDAPTIRTALNSWQFTS